MLLFAERCAVNILKNSNLIVDVSRGMADMEVY